MGRKPKAPWGDLLSKPGRPPPREWASAEKWGPPNKYQKMVRLKERYGADSWYDLAFAIASELDDALTIIDTQPKGKKAPRWVGPEGEALVQMVEDIRDEKGEDLSWKKVLIELNKTEPKIHECPDKLKADYWRARNHWYPRRKKQG